MWPRLITLIRQYNLWPCFVCWRIVVIGWIYWLEMAGLLWAKVIMWGIIWKHLLRWAALSDELPQEAAHKGIMFVISIIVWTRHGLLFIRIFMNNFLSLCGFGRWQFWSILSSKLLWTFDLGPWIRLDLIHIWL